MAADECHAPADHIESLRHRVDLDADFLGPVDFQEAERRGVVAEQDVGGVLHHDDFVGVGEIDDAAVKVLCCGSAGRAIRIIEDKEFSLAADIGRDGRQVRIKAVFLAERQRVNLAAVVSRVCAGDGITRNGH